MRLRSTALAAVMTLGLSLGVVHASTAPAAAEAIPTVAVIGDSYTLASGAGYTPYPSPTWAAIATRGLGWQVVKTVADPAGGYLTKGERGTFLDALKANPLPSRVNYVIVEGGLNDSKQNPASMPAAIDALVALVHQQAPNAVLLVIGSFLPRATQLDSPNQLLVARAIAEKYAATRYVDGVMLNYETGPDGVHPSPRGHQQIGAWVLKRFTSNLDSGRALVRSASGYYTA